MRATIRPFGCLLAIAALAGLGQVGVVGAQPRESRPVDLPEGPAKPGFDIERFSNAGNGWFETFYVEDTQPLRKAREAGEVAADTRVLVIQTAGGKLALLTDQMAYHHLAQGRADGKDWMATF
jgi:hypothetical protein